MRRKLTLVLVLVSLLAVTGYSGAEVNNEDDGLREVSWYIIPLWLPEFLMGYGSSSITA